MSVLRALTLCLLALPLAAAAAAPLSDSEAREKFVACLKKAGPARDAVCIGNLPGYPQPVAVLVPRGFRHGAKLELVLYLHGNNYEHRLLQEYLGKRPLAAALARSKRNAVLVMPQSLGKYGVSPTPEFDFQLSTREGFEGFVRESISLARVAGLVERDEPGGLALVAHSGGFRAMGAIVALESDFRAVLKEAYCLDCLYGHQEEFAAFAAQKGHRFWTIVTERGGTRAATAKIQALLRDAGVGYFGCNQKSKELPDVPKACPASPDGIAAPTLKDLAAFDAGFHYSTVNHEEASYVHLAKLLTPVAP